MELADVKNQLDSMSENLSRLITSVAPIVPAVQQLQHDVAEIQAERAAAQQAIAAQKSTQERETERKELLDEMTQRFEQTATQVLARAVNPSGVPPRKTVPLSASQDADSQTNVTPMQLELIQAQAQLDALRTANVDSQQRLQLVEKVRTLKYQLGIVA